VRSTTTNLLVVNISPNSGTLSVTQNLQPIGAGTFTYLNQANLTNPAYSVVDSGFQNYKIRKNAVEIGNFLYINRGINNSLWIFDSMTPVAYRYVYLNDVLDTPGRFNAKIRILDFVPDIDTFNVRINNSLVQNGNWVYFNQKLIEETQLSNYILLDTGVYNISFIQKTSQSLLKSYRIRLAGNGIYSFALKGYRNRSGADSLSLAVIQHN
jgi:hypothetical protein